MQVTTKRLLKGKAVCLMALVSLTATAFAQTPIDKESLNAQAPTSDWSVQLGAILINWPEYQGADANENVAYPLLTIEYKDRYFIDTIEGIGVQLVTNKPYTLAAGITIDQGRAENDSTRLEGLGDIDSGPGFKLKAGYQQDAFSYTASLEHALSGDKTGYRLDLEAGYTRVVSGNLVINPAVVARFGSKDYAQKYFGIDDSQSSASGLEAYFPGAGLASAGLQLSVTRIFQGNWTLQGKIKWERLLGDAADSPIVFDKNQVTLALAALYQFR